MAVTPPARPITTPQVRVLKTIDRWLRTHRYAPTVRDIGYVLGYRSSATVWFHLAALRRDGRVDWLDGQVRTLHLTLEGLQTLKQESR